jgi:CarD family transcriptional regulator
MAQKSSVSAKSKATKTAQKSPSKPGSPAKKTPAVAAKTPARASSKKAAVPTKPTKSSAKSKVTTASTPKKMIKVVKAAAAPVKPVAKVSVVQKQNGKNAVSQKTHTVASGHARAAVPTNTSVVPVPAKPVVAEAVVKPAPVKSVTSAKPVEAAAAPRPAMAPVAAAPAAVVRAAAPVQPVRAVPAVAKPMPAKTSAPPAGAKDAADRVAITQQQLAAAAAAAAKKPVSQRHGFKKDEFVVYPAHGVGRIVGIEEQEIAGMSLELFVISFEKDKMTLRVPTGKLASVGMRKLAEEDVVRKAMETLKGRARVKRTMWSRRAQEYEAKINSGDLVSIAEVVRDLYRSEQQPEQSYSERQLYEAALDRMAREIAAVDRIDERNAVQRITEVLSKSAKGRRLASEAAEAEAADAESAAEEVKAA